jgi:ABC-type lipoprotein export system ATPase subunit
MSIIEAKGITKVYQRGREAVHALKGVDLSVEAGEFVSIVGPSGAGKTALLNILGCLDTPTSGTLNLDNATITGRTERELVKVRRGTIGFVFQQFFLIPTLTAWENIGLPLLFNHQMIDNRKIDRILSQVDLSDRASHYPHQLSGGEMQRVAIGRALVGDPKILLADEPTGNLDTENSDRIFDLFTELNRQGLTILVVTHNPGLAGRTGRVVRLKDGLIQNNLLLTSECPV